MSLTLYNINSALKDLNISTSGVIRDGWLEILCPLPSHGKPDKHYGNCSIHIPTGIIACFSCQGRSNIFKLYQKAFNLTYQQALEKIHQDSVIDIKYTPEQTITTTFYGSKAEYNFTTTPLKPQKYFYTRQRGFTESFCKEFNIVQCLSGIYMDYMVTPIIDTAKNIQEFECRKLMEYDYLKKYFKVQDVPYYKLKNQLNKIIKEKKLRVIKDKLLDGEKEEIFDDVLKYLVKSKVLYPSNSKNKLTLLNIDDLDYSEDLYLFEGTGSVPKTYQYITKNVSVSFGAKVTEAQIEYLQKFTHKIIHVPDFDAAGYISVKKLAPYLKDNYFIKVPKKEDTDKDFILYLEKSPLLTPSEYLSKYLKLNFLT
jgi:DNA primase